MATTLHAHIDRATSDCDGPFYSSYVEFLNDDEKALHDRALAEGLSKGYDGAVNDFHDLHFKERILGGQVSFHPEEDAEVHITKAGFTVSEQTDEGYRRVEVRWCEDETCTPTYTQRDVYAEMMGY